jgi:hypothetical protein
VRIEVGYGLEPVLTDALSSVIIQSAILPKFRDGDMSGGIVDGTNAIVEQLSLPADQAKVRIAEASQPEDARRPMARRSWPVHRLLPDRAVLQSVPRPTRPQRPGLGPALDHPGRAEQWRPRRRLEWRRRWRWRRRRLLRRRRIVRRRRQFGELVRWRYA